MQKRDKIIKVHCKLVSIQDTMYKNHVKIN